MGQRAAGEAQLRWPLPAARADRAGLLRSARPGNARSSSESRARARHPRLLLLLLLVQRQAIARPSARRGRPIGSARLSVLRVLGERELDAALGRRQRRAADRTNLLVGERAPSDRTAAASLPRPALHPCERPAANRCSPRGSTARPAVRDGCL